MYALIKIFSESRSGELSSSHGSSREITQTTASDGNDGIQRAEDG